MSRTRAYRREMRKQKIKQRRMKIKAVRRFYSDEFENGYIHGRKIQRAVFGDKAGLLSKGYYGAMPISMKTKTKNIRELYRRKSKGFYGKSIVYSRHDMKRIEGMRKEERMWTKIGGN